MLAHELRNPLAPIVNALEIMRLGGEAEPRLNRAREVIERQTSHLTRLVDELLEVSRITIGKITLRREAVEIGGVLTQALEAARPLMEARKHQVDVTLPDGPMRARGDAMRLTQVLLNLLNNAAKYTPEGGKIQVQARREADHAVIRVRDNGYGIVPELLPHIFDLFTQGERAPDRSQGGLGIGLTLVHRLVELHGGRIEAFSAGAGHGSEFVVRLPLLPSPVIETEAAQPQVEPAAKTARRVLVVDDNLDCAESLAELLGYSGYEAAIARDGQSAIDSVESFKPEVVLLDIGLPGTDGYEVARILRRKFADRKLLLIAISGYGQENDRARSKAAGFDYHMVKPVIHAELLRRIAAR
jgi:two-component system CheB/CheR fusion protein